LRDYTSFEPLIVKVRPGVQAKNKDTRKLYFTRLPRRPPWTDFRQTWMV